MRRLAVLLVALCLPGVAVAATRPCADLEAQQDRNACIGAALGEADAALNRAYRQLGDRLDANGRRNLVAAQRAWIVFRDRECELRSGYDTQDPGNNGTLAPFLVGDCKRDLTGRRTADLLDQLTCPGGDPSCTR
ncbi:hypothetical protein ASG40_03840 [Methylobacterium sp. Leaf399]|uniref:lysozyme inhibitor LprI family protein n=1 Tax=unclassified Methylobacterium TaxID=2615210 RepID=UPI0006F3F768|nr:MULTISPECIES: lysozyme inhibitor LprI family protein [unclassified Methylobacterium]KQT19941.1 hypothetical protein ASG40_03840 [Methylobacterium sp. Leaf399]KQT78462.1 hypothetical protein ASG59_08280 [Methylobacterium sp. Leaf466]